MSTSLILLAILMWAVTYPTRAVGLLMPAFDRLPRVVFDYLQLVGPAVLTALAATGVMIRENAAGQSTFYVGIEWVAVLVCMVVTAWRKNLLFGLLASVALVAVARAIGVAALP
jgi:branched-subunit amino acid transport protein